jgi:hypothetical protein
MLASRLEGWLNSGDVGSITAVHRVQSFTCPGGAPMGPGGAFPLCTGAPAGEMRNGIQIARRYSEGAIISTDAYGQFLGQVSQAVDAGSSDAYGTGALKLEALSCVDQTAQPTNCPQFVVIFSGIFRPSNIPPLGMGTGREVLLFFAETPAGASMPQITSTWTGIVMANEAPIIFQTGGTLFDLGRVFPVN